MLGNLQESQSNLGTPHFSRSGKVSNYTTSDPKKIEKKLRQNQILERPDCNDKMMMMMMMMMCESSSHGGNHCACRDAQTSRGGLRRTSAPSLALGSNAICF